MTRFSSSSENIENRVIRIFISSTFSDMQEERDMLILKVFPKLSKIAAQRDVMIVPLDLRWGITDEAAKEGKVIETCLNEIMYSRPFFLGLIGNRYGSCLSLDEAQKNKQLLNQYIWLERDMADGLSITEIEIQYGVLRNPEKINAFFYLKDGDVDESDNPTKLSRLKEEIRENGRYPVDDYVTIEDLAEKVESAFMEVLDKYFPEKELSFLEKDRIAQRAFLHSREIAYVPIREAYEVLDGFLEGEEQCFVVTGESGMGKSALVANWLKHAGLLQNKNRKVIYHSVEVGGLNGDYRSIAKRLCDEIRDLYDLSRPKKGKLKRQEPEDILKRSFEKIKDQKPLLIVLDGINRLMNKDDAKQLLWLPKTMLQVKYLFTTLPDDETMNVFKRLNYPVYTLQPLDIVHREELVKEYLAEYGKKLSLVRVERIIQDPLNENTLVLRVLLDELCSFGYHELLDERIDYYLGASSIGNFFQRVLERIENDLREFSVDQILAFITFSCKGLAEQEILELSGLNVYEWAIIHGVFRQYFVYNGGLLTFSHFYIAKACKERYLREEKGVRRKLITYFLEIDEERSWEELAFQYCKLEDYKELYRLLLRFPVFHYFYGKNKYGLLFYWKLLLDKGKNCFTPQKYFSYICDDKKQQECYYEQLSLFFMEFLFCFVVDSSPSFVIVSSFIKRLLEIRKSFLGELHIDVANSYCRWGVLCGIAGNYRQALKNIQKSLEINIALGRECDNLTGYSYYLLGLVYYNLKDYNRALLYSQKSLEIYIALGEEYDLQVFFISNEIGLIYLDLQDYDNAIKYYHEELMSNWRTRTDDKFYLDFILVDNRMKRKY